MFFPDRINSIKETDKVLEIGPGATPYFRSDVFLEKEYETEKELIEQSGHVGILRTDKRKVTFKGDKFPFADNEFDYVICSHVLEHVNNADSFLKEIQRVGKKGYLEFPTIYYDYIYNFPEHKLFLLYKDGVINWMTKEESGLLKYNRIQLFFNKSREECGYNQIIIDLRDYFFQGFEWFDEIKHKRVKDINEVLYNLDNFHFVKKEKEPDIVKQKRSKFRKLALLLYKTLRFIYLKLDKIFS